MCTLWMVSVIYVDFVEKVTGTSNREKFNSVFLFELNAILVIRD